MRRSRIGLALAGMAVCTAALVQIAPPARDAFALLWAQDDPSELADVRLNSALRNAPSLVVENIEAALAADDADLANSFAELARDKSIPLSEAACTSAVLPSGMTPMNACGSFIEPVRSPSAWCSGESSVTIVSSYGTSLDSSSSLSCALNWQPSLV